MTKKYNISKELINAVLDVEIKGVYFAPNGRFFEIWDISRDDRIDTNDFFFRCKEWAYKQGYVLRSEICDIGGCLILTIEDQGYLMNQYEIEADSEQQAVFDACQWILENKGKE